MHRDISIVDNIRPKYPVRFETVFPIRCVSNQNIGFQVIDI